MNSKYYLGFGIVAVCALSNCKTAGNHQASGLNSTSASSASIRGQLKMGNEKCPVLIISNCAKFADIDDQDQSSLAKSVAKDFENEGELEFIGGWAPTNDPSDKIFVISDVKQIGGEK